MKLPKNKTVLIAGVAAAAVMTTAAAVMAVWPALTRPDPPAEAAGDGGLRIRVVAPPKAAVPRAGPLDVGLSEAAQATAKGREALFAGTSPPPASPLPPARNTRAEDDGLAAPEPADDRWERERTGSGFELARRLREEERAASREHARREAWEETERDRRWDEERERDRADAQRRDDEYDPPPFPDDDRPSPEPQ